MRSIAPSLWGSSAWRYLDTVVSGTADLESMADDELERVLKFWEWLILPCDECMKNYTAFLSDHPVDEITSNSAYARWYELLKESVSRHTAKQPTTPPPQQNNGRGCRSCSAMVRIPPTRRGGVHFMRRFNR